MLKFIAHNIWIFIVILGVMEGAIFAWIYYACRVQTLRLLDVLENMLKPFPDGPDIDSMQGYHDRLRGILAFFDRKLHVDRSAAGKIRMAMQKLVEHNKVAHTYRIEQMYNIASSIVQIFPLAGVLGTVLGLGQISGAEDGAIKASAVTQAFVGSINGTVVGVAFAIVFMFLEAHALARVSRLIEESKAALALATTPTFALTAGD